MFVFIHWPNGGESELILEQERGLATGKLDLVFYLGGDAVAGRRAKSPDSHRAQNAAIPNRASALENQRAVNASVSANNKANLDVTAITNGHDQRIRRGQSLWRLNIFTSCEAADMGNGVEFGPVGHICPNVEFALVQG